MDRKLFGIVDPYSSGSLLARELHKRGAPAIMVQSTATIPDIFRSSFHPGEFREIIRYNDRAEAAETLLRDRGVSTVVAGCELGVEIADRLSEQLGLPSNGTRFSGARRNKHRMAQAVGARGLRVPDQCCSSGLSEILEWTRCHGRWPVIVKPVRSCASDGVHRCASEWDVETAYRNIMNTRNIFGEENTEVLVQEFLFGTEYVVDTVSCGGRHRAAGFWRYGKPSGADFVCYDSMELLPYDGALQSRLFTFACGVLDALGVQFGPAHCELMCHDGTITLIEIATRLSAGNNATLSRDCGAACQLDLTIEAYMDPAGFLNRMHEPQSLKRGATNFFLMPRKRGRLLGVPKLGEIRGLPSFHKASVGATIGEPAPRVAGLVTLIHSDPDVVADDVRTLRALGDRGLFEIEETDAGANR
jgi:hypothetical protein